MKEIASQTDSYAALLRAIRNSGIEAKLGQQQDVVLTWDGRSVLLEVKSAGHGWPSDVQRALSLRSPKSGSGLTVLFAREFSESAKQLLVSHEANWLDGAGSIHLRLPGRFLLHIERPPHGGSIGDMFTWSRSAIEIAEHLLSRQPKRIQLAEVANFTGWSRPRVSKLLQQFDLLGWTSRFGPRRGKGVWRELSSPGSMLEAWAAEVSKPEWRGTVVLGHAVLRDVTDFATGSLTSALRGVSEFAFTSWVAASQLAPFSTIVPLAHVYLPIQVIESGRYESILQACGLREVNEGGNVRFESAKSHVFKYAVEGQFPVASRPRIYADLLETGGRGKDVADHFRESAIGY